MELDIIKEKKVAELREIARALKIEGADKLKKKEIIDILTRMHQEAQAQMAAEAKAEDPKADAEPAKEAEKPAEEAKKEAEAQPKKRRGRPKKQAAETAENADAQGAKAEDKAQDAKAEGPAPKAAEDALADGSADSASEECAENNAAAYAGSAAEGSAAQADEPAQPSKYDNRYDTTGILELSDNGFGFLRFENFLTSDKDIYVSPTQIRRFNLKTGDEILGVVRKPNEGERFGALLYVRTVNGDEPGVAKYRKDFSDLTPIYPQERICLEKGSNALSMRLTDLVAPIGKGQRGLIVAPPKAGKTTLLKQIAKAIEAQDLGVKLMVLLIDERPEEVTDMKESIKGDVIYSTFDEQPQHHVKVAEMVLERAERLCEHGKDVVILMDSITRLARAYNLVEPPSGRTLSGGLDPAALYKPKKFFGAARNTREGGSITILATALIETGSRMDDMIFEEFKGTGNMELHLDRRLQEKRIFPAININKTGTRREDMLMSPEELEAVWLMRRAVADWGVEEATEKIVFDLVHTKSNYEFIQRFLKTRL